MRITGTRSTITFDLENGYAITGTGEILVGGKFAVATDSLTQWNAPNEDRPFTPDDLSRLKKKTAKHSSPQTVQIIFD